MRGAVLDEWPNPRLATWLKGDGVASSPGVTFAAMVVASPSEVDDSAFDYCPPPMPKGSHVSIVDFFDSLQSEWPRFCIMSHTFLEQL